jgi:hypothetical protein
MQQLHCVLRYAAPSAQPARRVVPVRKHSQSRQQVHQHTVTPTAAALVCQQVAAGISNQLCQRQPGCTLHMMLAAAIMQPMLLNKLMFLY